MNADRMIAVFLSGVLVGGAVVYLAPNNGLSSGGHQGSQTGVGGQGGGGPSGGQPNAGAKGETPSGDIGAGGASAAPSGSAPGAQGSLENGPVGGSTGGMMDTTAVAGSPGSGGQGGGGEADQGGGDDVPSPISPVPVSGAPQGATRLLRHLQLAPTLWKAQAEDALQSASPKSRALASEIATHAAGVPIVTDKLPQTPNIVSYLLDSKLLLIRMKEAGMDINALETQIDEVSRARK